MNNLDSTDHLFHDSAHLDDASRGLAQMREHARSGGGEEEKRWDDDEHYQATQAAYDESSGREQDREDWEQSKEHREWLRERYPDTRLADYGDKMVSWHKAFQRDPITAKEMWVRHWASRPPFHHKPSDKPKAEEPPADLDVRGREEWQLWQDTKNAVRSVKQDANDASDFEASGPLRQYLRENKLTLTEFLRKSRDIETASLDDPAGVAHRFAVFSGLPATQQQAAEMQAAVAQHQQAVASDHSHRMAAAEHFIEQVRQQVPDFNLVEARVGDLLQEAHRQGYHQIGDPQNWPAAITWAMKHARAELLELGRQTAAQQRMMHVPTEPDPAAARAAVERSLQASRSVSGGPNPGASSNPSSRPRGNTSYDDDLYQDVANAVRGSV